ncbi:sensor histidine kinase [Methylotuvimicrobium alcaliphilum]|uniref:Two-component sensor histidine kinase n=1 Tax=Methylotuvimicrobium alcaliphilum (strain DSM 19304 / NCIMB 14124 / VKM B-2133 / 20Z) TaxID=1091494 RepID=G4T410_META2|nr:histidine kinase [Methylotuvimicrobium alcaliphilum]CCE23745.1 putative two-component sensor histidine kinase [Methylotuvimicrobium alcaliphilum 20Z]
MNLQLNLLTRIALVALACLLVIAAFVLYQSHCVAKQTTGQMAESLGKQLESQLLLINVGLGQTNPFPDFGPWKHSGNQPGICLSYTPADGSLPRSLCNGSKLNRAEWPTFFETGYRQIFNPGLPAIRPVALNGRLYGSLTITPSAELEIAEAWNRMLSLMTLSGVTVLAVCLLVYWNISRVLKPAKTIVAGIKEMEYGHLDCRLPAFELNEWQRIAAAINQLANSQQQLLDERQKLVLKLINIQEGERRYLARELHDEFGQCLAAINAVAASIKQTALQQCPALVAETDHISRITTHMLENVHGLLGRLRPAEFEELGLAASLNSLVAGWNARSGDKTRFHLDISGDCSSLTEVPSMTLFRITQECLTNIAKHATASHVSISLIIGLESAILTVADNGVAKTLPLADTAGIGLLGIRERVTALQGRLQLAIANPHGLIVEVCLPIAANIEHTA